MDILSYGTRVRITARHNHYCGRIGFINDDNNFDRWLAEQAGEPIPDYCYNIDIPTSDGNDIEHTHAAPGEFRVMRGRKQG